MTDVVVILLALKRLCKVVFSVVRFFLIEGHYNDEIIRSLFSVCFYFAGRDIILILIADAHIMYSNMNRIDENKRGREEKIEKEGEGE